MKKVRWGIISAGWIATQFATALYSLEDAEIIAVAARDLKRAQIFADKFGITKAYGSYEELAKDPDVDVVFIGTTHTEHKANTALCINHGKPVLCEKPFTINQKETEFLIDLAKEKNVFLMEAMWTKFLPTTLKVKEWIKDNRIGQIRHAKISFGYYTEFDIKSRLFNPEVAGGALLDVGIYPITYITYMLEKYPNKIVSEAILGKSNVDEQNVIIFCYNEGILADLSSAVSVETGKDALIIGDKGKIRVPNFWMAEGAELYDENGNIVESFLEPFAVNGYVYEAQEVNKCLREDKLESDVVPLKDTLAIMKLMDEIRGQWGLVYKQEID